MSTASIKKIIPCKKEQLIEMVLNIEQYPEFVPWCIEGKVHDKNESADLITFNGDLKVGKSIIKKNIIMLNKLMKKTLKGVFLCEIAKIKNLIIHQKYSMIQIHLHCTS